jgi:hypothetical protein
MEPNKLLVGWKKNPGKQILQTQIGPEYIATNRWSILLAAR